MTFFFDNIILFLNVLEQFAIKINILGLDLEDICKYVNNNFNAHGPLNCVINIIIRPVLVNQGITIHPFSEFKMTFFFDNIILFLNVLEQFAIRVTIFGTDLEDIIKYVNKLYFSETDDCIKNILKKTASVNQETINPYTIIKEANKALDKKIINDILFEKLEYKYNVTNQFRFIY